MSARSKIQKQAIQALDLMYKQGDTETIGVIEKILLPKEVKLPKDLKEILDSFKDNPLDGTEKEIFDAKENYEILKIALGDKIDDFSSMDSALFKALMIEKISAFKDEDGFYKMIPSLVAIGIPTNSQLAEIQKAIKPISKEILEQTDKTIKLVNKQMEDTAKYRTIIDGDNMDGDESLPKIIEDMANFSEKQKKLNEKTTALGNKIKETMVNVVVEDMESLTEWELNLITSFVNDYVKAINAHTIQSPADFSPFAKYIKN